MITQLSQLTTLREIVLTRPIRLMRKLKARVRSGENVTRRQTRQTIGQSVTI